MSLGRLHGYSINKLIPHAWRIHASIAHHIPHSFPQHRPTINRVHNITYITNMTLT